MATLVGFGGGVGGATLSFDSHYRATTHTDGNLDIINDAGGAAGDTAVVIGCANPLLGGDITYNAVTDWSNPWADNTSDEYAWACWIKTLVGDETDETFFTGIGQSIEYIIFDVMLFNGAPGAPTANSVIHRATAGDPASGIITASAHSGPVIVVGAAWLVDEGNNSISSFTFTPAATATYTGTTGTTPRHSLVTKYIIYASEPEDTTIDVGDGGTVNGLGGTYLSF